MNTSVLERLGNEVAHEVMPDTPKDGLKGFDFISIAIIVIAVFQAIVQACPKPPAQIAKDMRKPSMLQRAALLKKAKETCEAEGNTGRTKEVYRAMLLKASQLSDTDALAAVNEAQTDTNLLI